MSQIHTIFPLFPAQKRYDVVPLRHTQGHEKNMRNGVWERKREREVMEISDFPLEHEMFKNAEEYKYVRCAIHCIAFHM